MMKKWKEFHPIVKFILIGSIITNISNGMIVPYFTLYLYEYVNLNIVQIGFLIGISSLTAMIGGFFGGTLSDLIGRRSVMTISLVISAFVMVGFTFHTFPLLLILLTIVKGFIVSFFDPCAKALISDLTKKEHRLSAFSMKYFSVNIGFAIGPIVGILLALNETSTVPFYIAFSIFLTYSLLLNMLLTKYNVSKIAGENNTSTSIGSSFKTLARDKVLFLFLIGGTLATIVHGEFTVTLSQYFNVEFKRGLVYLGILWSVHSIVIIFLTIPISNFMSSRTPLQAIKIGTILFALGTIFFGISFNLPTFLVAMIIFTIGEIFLIPAEYAIIDEITPEHIRGTYYGAASFTTLGSFIGPGLSSLLLVKFNGYVMFIFLTCICLISILFYMWGMRVKNSQHIEVAVVTKLK